MSKKVKMNRRQFVKKASTTVAGASVIAAGSGTGISMFSNSASAAGNVRRDILKIPGVGKGSPTDSDWQKVGAMCLEPTKARVSKGEFNGVELTFMGLNTCSGVSSSPGRSTLEQKLNGLTLHRLIIMPASSNPSPLVQWILTFWKWVRHLKVMSAARAWLPKCLTGLRIKLTWMIMLVT